MALNHEKHKVCFMNTKFPLGICEICRKKFAAANATYDWDKNIPVKETRNSRVCECKICDVAKQTEIFLPRPNCLIFVAHLS